MNKSKELIDIMEKEYISYIPKVGDFVRYTEEYLKWIKHPEYINKVGKVIQLKHDGRTDCAVIQFNDEKDVECIGYYYIEPVKQMSLFKEDNERMISLTYGHLPNFSDFDRAFRKEVYNNTYSYNLKGSDSKVAEKVGIPGSGSFTSRELYDTLKKLIKAWDRGNEEAGDITASFLYTLGFEWI